MASTQSHLHLPVEDLDFIVDSVGQRWSRLQDKRLLLTGGTGFIGKWLLASFLRANRRLGLRAKMVVLSRSPQAFHLQFPELRDATELTWVTGDVRNLPPEVGMGCEFAIHAATDVVSSNTPTETLDTCITGTRRVLEALSQGDCLRRVLLLSSGAVYGRIPPDFDAVPEDWLGAPDPLAPASAYGEGKRISELLCALAAASQPSFEVSIARCFAFVGPHLPLDQHFAIGNFIDSALQHKDIIVQGDGTPLRSYLYSADLAHWLWVMLFDAPSGRAYNVGGSARVSIHELAHRVNRALEGRGEVRVARPAQPGRPQVYVPAVSRIATELGLEPTVDLDEAIKRTALWAAQRRSA